MRSISKILVPTDGSRDAMSAAETAASLARRHSADITLLHVVEPARLPLYVIGMRPYDQSAYWSRQLAYGRAVLEGVRSQIPGTGASVNTELREGPPGKTIVEVAARDEYDLIVMGRRTLGPAQRLLADSVSDDVAANAPCPVLTVSTGKPVGVAIEPVREREAA